MCLEPSKTGRSGTYPPTGDLTNARKQPQRAKQERARFALPPFFSILLSVEENQCNQLDDALDQAEVKLNELLPPPGAPPRAKLPFDDDEDGTVPTAVTEVCR